MTFLNLSKEWIKKLCKSVDDINFVELMIFADKFFVLLLFGQSRTSFFNLENIISIGLYSGEYVTLNNNLILLFFTYYETILE
jgi:hypothetical protein